jgi:hypothetical protein
VRVNACLVSRKRAGIPPRASASLCVGDRFCGRLPTDRVVRDQRGLATSRAAPGDDRCPEGRAGGLSHLRPQNPRESHHTFLCTS